MTQATGRLLEIRKPAQRAAMGAEVREGSTGRVVMAMPVRLPRVWAVAEVSPAGPASCGGRGEHLTLCPGAAKDGAPELKAELAGESLKAELAGESLKAELAGESLKAELAFYRKYTEALLRRYMRLSMSAGRVPSLMGRELFRGHVSHYKAHTFEDVAIFCFDVERQLARLTPEQKELVKRIALQQYTQMEVAGMLGVTLRHCVRLYAGTLDRMTELFLAARLLEPQKLSRG